MTAFIILRVPIKECNQKIIYKNTDVEMGGKYRYLSFFCL